MATIKSIEQKAKAYDEAIKVAADIKAGTATYITDGTPVIDAIFPELKESEDERIKEEIVKTLKYANEIGGILNDVKCREYIAWLEKQGEHNHIDKIEPKFKVGDVMRTLQEAANNITSGLPVVVSIDEEYYHCTNELIAIKDQDDYEYPPMNRAIAWSEEDEYCINQLIVFCENCMIPDSGAKRCADWLKSFKDRFVRLAVI